MQVKIAVVYLCLGVKLWREKGVCLLNKKVKGLVEMKWLPERKDL